MCSRLQVPGEEEKQISLRLHNIESDLLPASAFVGDFKTIELTASSFETWQTAAIARNTTATSLKLNGTFVGVWEKRGVDGTRIDTLDFHMSDVDTLETEAIAQPSDLRDVTIFSNRFRVVQDKAFDLGSIWRLRLVSLPKHEVDFYDYLHNIIWATLTGRIKFGVCGLWIRTWSNFFVRPVF